MATTRNLYDILSVPQGASSDDVRKAYKFKVLETHPDKLPPGSDEATIAAAEAEFRDIRTAFDVLSDPAKRKAYDNGLNFVKRRVNVNPEDVQVRLARERAEWHKQAEARHQERMKVLHEEIGASQKRYQESLAQTELRYQEKMRTIEEQLTLHREVARAVAAGEPEGTYTLVDEMLSDLRRRCPEWEIRRQKVLKQRVERVKEEAQAVQILAE